MQRPVIFDIPVDIFDANEALESAELMLQSLVFHHIISLNPEILLAALRDPLYAAILKKGDLMLPDGIGLVWFGRILGIPFKERIAGVDFMMQLAGLAAKKGKSVFLLGSRNDAAQKTAETLRRRFPKLMIRWSEDTEMTPDADIVFVALGAPRQEHWIAAHQKKLTGTIIAMGVGGAFDMISGITPRAPRMMRTIGLEWLWRFALEPKKRFQRIINAVVVFPIKITAHALVKSK